MKANNLVAPFLKWAGGKRQLIPVISKLLPKSYTTYYEPFVGGGAVLFHLQPGKAVISDVNQELINVYQVIKNNHEELIIDLKKHQNESDYFYTVRAWDKQENFNELSTIKKASRIIYLNKTCYNGLYRVNRSGEFNSPFGRYKNPNIVNETTIRTVSKYLNNNEIDILTTDFEIATDNAKKRDFVYFDPPYYPLSKSASFTGYVKGGFNTDEQIRLKQVCDKLNEKGVYFLLSNSAVTFIEELYKDYNKDYVKANRYINSNAKKRGEVREILIRNYE